MTAAYTWNTVGWLRLLTDELVELSKCSRVAMTLRRQLSNARHDHVRESTLQHSLTAKHRVQLHTYTRRTALLRLRINYV